MGGSGKWGSPKWLVYFMENPIKMDDLGVPLFQETSKWQIDIIHNALFRNKKQAVQTQDAPAEKLLRWELSLFACALSALAGSVLFPLLLLSSFRESPYSGGSAFVFSDMGVSKNGGTLKWMVYNGKPY